MTKLNKKQIYDLVNFTKCELKTALSEVDKVDRSYFLWKVTMVAKELEILEGELKDDRRN